MSERKADKTAVAAAMAAIRERGEEPTIEKIRARIGGGSPDTIMNTRRQVEEEALAAKDSPELLGQFRLFYWSAHQAGRASCQTGLDGLTAQVVQLTHERDAGRTRERDLVVELQSSRKREGELQAELTAALRDASAKAAKLETLLLELGSAKDRLHQFELSAAAKNERAKTPPKAKTSAISSTPAKGEQE